MSDITKQPYAKWLEECLRELVELKPTTIGIVALLPGGLTATQYYNANNGNRLVMMESIFIDYLHSLVVANADNLRELLIEGEDEE